MTKKLSASIFLAGFLLIALFGVSSQGQLWAQEPELRKSRPLPPAPQSLTGEAQAQTAADAQSVSSPYPLYGSGDFFLPPYLSDNDRMGYNKTSDHDTTPLKPGWYHNWSTLDNPPHPGGAEFGQTIYFNISGVSRCHSATQHSQILVNITDAALISRVQANPGAMWMIGNEPDSYFNGSPIHPHLYAELYHHYYTLIKNADPSAKIAMGSVVQPSPKRMEYLDKVLTHYQATYTETLKTDLWGIHLYRLNEASCTSGGWGAATPPDSSGHGWYVNFSASDILSLSNIEQSIRDFRQWMYDRGYGDVPLIVTEYGVLPPSSYSGFSDAVAAQFLEDSFNMLLTATDSTTGLPADGHRLVQMWSWFSTDHNPPPGYFKYGGDLFTSGGDLTVIGQRFQQMATGHYTPYVDLQPVPPTSVVSTTNAITVTAYLQNRGNLSATAPSVSISLLAPGSGITVAETLVNVADIQSRYAGASALLTSGWRVTTTETITTTVPYTVHIQVVSGDANPANDNLFFPVSWRPLLDLDATNITFSTGSIFLFQEPVTVTAAITVTNRGGWPAPQNTLDITLSPPKNETPRLLAQDLFVPPLSPQSSASFTVTFPVTQTGIFALSAALSSTLNGVDLYAANNHYTATLMSARNMVRLPLILRNY